MLTHAFGSLLESPFLFSPFAAISGTTAVGSIGAFPMSQVERLKRLPFRRGTDLRESSVAEAYELLSMNNGE
jgi:hypothetical protein